MKLLRRALSATEEFISSEPQSPESAALVQAVKNAAVMLPQLHEKLINEDVDADSNSPPDSRT
jgi:hypothetical protein